MIEKLGDAAVLLMIHNALTFMLGVLVGIAITFFGLWSGYFFGSILKKRKETKQ